MTKIDQKIVGWKVVTEQPQSTPQEVEQEVMHEAIVRPQHLDGETYKIKTPMSDHALYITINDIILNGDQRQPFEIFVNSKAMEHFQWIVALTRVISAVFRKGGDCTFLIEELKSVFDPKGGYFKQGKWMPSLVSEIGEVIEHHLIAIGLYQKDESLAEVAKVMLAEKLEKKPEQKMLLCPKCNQLSAIMMDGCLTCTDAGCYYSKCG